MDRRVKKQTRLPAGSVRGYSAYRRDCENTTRNTQPNCVPLSRLPSRLSSSVHICCRLSLSRSEKSTTNLSVCISSSVLLRELIFIPGWSHYSRFDVLFFLLDNLVIASAALEVLPIMIIRCRTTIHLIIVQADVIRQIINTLNPQSLSFEEAEDIHINIMKNITNSVWLATTDGLEQLEIEDNDEEQAVHETGLKQVLVPSETYIWHLCVNRFSIVDGNQSKGFLALLATLLEISPYYQHTMDFVVKIPIVVTIPSCITFFEDEHSIYRFLSDMVDAQLEWNTKGGGVRCMWKKIHRMLRMEGFEDVIEEKLQNDKNRIRGVYIVAYSGKLLLGGTLCLEE
ncbi:hypothetical protein BLNAU_18570 [Blattamonas nauphoetae]|uniref:Uncharacterized protein n=1 Tax=Blattamonas nauphoetae TaxID=2049346 RepID=A0ABQ9X4K3_9EUKA|nr:hypothetical protein BLNAU_18570 [Blattamonas nauphoetae]